MAARPAGSGWATAASIALCVVGLAVETLADWQKWRFKQEPTNRGLNCQHGLWSASQHPNWCGNILMWTGIVALNAPTLLAPSGLCGRRFAAALFSPLFLLALFYGQATDTIANAVELAAAKYKGQPGYTRYVETTPWIFPSAATLMPLLVGGDDKEL